MSQLGPELMLIVDQLVKVRFLLRQLSAIPILWGFVLLLEGPSMLYFVYLFLGAFN